MKKMTLLEQWKQLKKEHERSIILFHVGSFYEVLDFDAYLVNRILGFKITPRSVGGGEFLPMVGIPIKESKLSEEKLLESGFRLVKTIQTDDYIDGLRFRKAIDVLQPQQTNKNIEKYQKAFTIFIENDFVHLVNAKVKREREQRRNISESSKEHKFTKMLKGLNLDHLSGYDALKLLYDWQKEIIRTS